MGPSVTLGVSLKMYFGHGRALQWFEEVAERAGSHPVVTTGEVRLFVAPTYVQIPAALDIFGGTRIEVGAQDVAAAEFGAFTGEVSASELSEVGVTIAEIGHAERRRHFLEDDNLIATKVRAALRSGLTPLACIGEETRLPAEQAADEVGAQLERTLRGAGEGPVIVAYEPVWAIGASEPAPVEHIKQVTTSLRHKLRGRAGSAVIYGGSAGPGLLGELGGSVDGLFLGRFAHDVDNLISVLDEAATLR